MSKKLVDDVLTETKVKNRFVVEFNTEQNESIKALERKTGLSRDVIVFAALELFLEKPNGGLVKALDEQHRRKLEYIQSLGD